MWIDVGDQETIPDRSVVKTIQVCMRACVCVSLYASVCVRARAYVRVCLRVHAWVCVCVHVHVYVCACVCTYVHVCVQCGLLHMVVDNQVYFLVYRPYQHHYQSLLRTV